MDMEKGKPALLAILYDAYGRNDTAVGVMDGLFNRGYFHHILKDIFFRLRLSDLSACSRVSKQWHEYILANLILMDTRIRELCQQQLSDDQLHFFRERANVMRIVFNWLFRQPRQTILSLSAAIERQQRRLRYTSLGDEDEIYSDLEERQHGGSGASNELIPYGSQTACPSAVVADSRHIISATTSSIDVFCRKSNDHLFRLHSSELPVQWELCLSDKYLVGRQRHITAAAGVFSTQAKRTIHVWDRQNAYCKLAIDQHSLKVKAAAANGHNLPHWTDLVDEPHHRIRLAAQDVIICETSSRSRLSAVRIVPDRLKFEPVWRYSMTGMAYDQLTVVQDKIFMSGFVPHPQDHQANVVAIGSNARQSFRSTTEVSGASSHVFVQLLDAKSGRSLLSRLQADVDSMSQIKTSFEFETADSSEDVIKGIGFTQPLGIVLTGRSTEEVEGRGAWLTYSVVHCRIYLLDLAHHVVIRRLNFNCDSCFGDLSNLSVKIWCDPPVGLALMAVQSRSMAAVGSSRSLLIWDIERLLRSTADLDRVRPDRILADRAGIMHADVVVPSAHNLIHLSMDGRGRAVLVDSDFWGQL